MKYLRKQNRPYSATDISANLHNKVTKAAAAKILKDLHERKEIEGRAAGKQIVYHPIQDVSEAATPEDLHALDAEIQQLRDETAEAKIATSAMNKTLASLNATLSTADLRTVVTKVAEEKETITARLEKLRTGDVKPISAEEKEIVEKEMVKWKKCADNRAKIVKGMWGYVLEAVPEGADVAELKESLGVEV